MSATGGILKTLTIQGRSFAGGGAVTFFRGGRTKTLEPVGNGDVVTNLKPEVWEVKTLKVVVDKDNQDFEYLSEVAEDIEHKECSFELMDGDSYSGTGTIVEKVEWNSENTMAEFTMQGKGKLEQL